MYEDNARKINSILAAINPKAKPDVISLGHLDAMLQVAERLVADEVKVGATARRLDCPGRYSIDLTLPVRGCADLSRLALPVPGGQLPQHLVVGQQVGVAVPVGGPVQPSGLAVVAA